MGVRRSPWDDVNDDETSETLTVASLLADQLNPRSTSLPILGNVEID